MPKEAKSAKFDPSPYRSITSPIPLLALFGGITELIIGSLVFKTAQQYQPYLIAGAVFLPLAWLAVIFVLIAKYHQNLYAPRDFPQGEHFLATLSAQTRAMLERGTLGPGFSPFIPSEGTTAEDFSNIQRDISKTPWPWLLREMNATEFLTLHTLYNEGQNHSLALLTMNIAISKGLTASKNYGFASASLRKLGRLREAKAFAQIALQIDSVNVDARYNLALICKEMGDADSATELARQVLAQGTEYHKRRIVEEFSSLQVGSIGVPPNP
jgi:FimV-like protein